MSARSDRVRLHPSLSRCEPINGPCSMRSRCARLQAPIPAGTPVEDFTVTDLVGGGTAICTGFMSVADAHAELPAPRQVKPAVKGLT